MIDTHGLPMKFEFYWENRSGERYYYELDFNDLNEDGWPKLTNHDNGDVSWPRPIDDYVEYIKSGEWIITQVLEDVALVKVEDLL